MIMIKRVFLLLLLLLICATTLSGCWDYRELEDVSIVAGLAIDKNEVGQYLITVEIVDLSQSEKDIKINSKLLEASGKTLVDAIRNMFRITAPALYWGHAEVVIFSQEVAREGIIDVIDFVNRNPKPRTNIRLLVSRESTAREILKTVSITTRIRSFEIRKMIELYNKSLRTVDIQMYEFINELSSEGVSAVMAAIRLGEIEGEKTSQLSGAAVFKEDKLIGFLDEEETRFFHFIKEQTNGGGLIIVKDSSEDAKILIDITRSKVKVKPVYSGEKLMMDIEVKIEGKIDEYGLRNSYYFDSGGIIVLEKKAEEQLANEIKSTIRKVQENFDVDIFGFGSTVKAEMPKLWRKVGHEWGTLFKELDVNIDVTVDIYNSGLLYKPVKMGD